MPQCAFETCRKRCGVKLQCPRCEACWCSKRCEVKSRPAHALSCRHVVLQRISLTITPTSTPEQVAGLLVSEPPKHPERRGVFATRDFAMGECVLAEEPWVYVDGASSTRLVRQCLSLGISAHTLLAHYAHKARIQEATLMVAEAERQVNAIADEWHIPVQHAQVMLHVCVRYGLSVEAPFSVATLGLALYRFAPVLNHSCDPSVRLVFSADRRAMLFAARPIARGEEVSRAYMPQLVPLPVHLRWVPLREHFDEPCWCRRCAVEERSLAEQLERLQLHREGEHPCVTGWKRSVAKRDQALGTDWGTKAQEASRLLTHGALLAEPACRGILDSTLTLLDSHTELGPRFVLIGIHHFVQWACTMTWTGLCLRSWMVCSQAYEVSAIILNAVDEAADRRPCMDMPVIGKFDLWAHGWLMAVSLDSAGLCPGLVDWYESAVSDHTPFQELLRQQVVSELYMNRSMGQLVRALEYVGQLGSKRPDPHAHLKEQRAEKALRAWKQKRGELRREWRGELAELAEAGGSFAPGTQQPAARAVHEAPAPATG